MPFLNHVQRFIPIWLVACAWPILSISQTRVENTLLWKITHPVTKKSSFLFATTHRNDSIVLQVDRALIAAIKSCDVMALESDPAHWQDPFTKDPLALAFQPVALGPSTGDLHPAFFQLPDYRSAIRQALTELPATATNWMRYQPNNGRPFLDLLLYQLAVRLGKPITELESDATRQAILQGKSQPLANAFNYFDSEHINHATPNWDTLYDQGKLIELPPAAAHYSSQVDLQILELRNEHFVKRMIQLLQSKTACIAVGAAHLPGKHGILARLEAAGFRITPLPFNRQTSLLESWYSLPANPVSIRNYAYIDQGFELQTPNRLYYGNAYPLYPIMEYTDVRTGQIFVAGRIATAAQFRGYTTAEIRQQMKEELQQNTSINIVYTADTLVQARTAWRLIMRDVYGLWHDRLLVLDDNKCWILGWNGPHQDHSRAAEFYQHFQIRTKGKGTENVDLFQATVTAADAQIDHRAYPSVSGAPAWSIQHTIPPHLRLISDTTLLRFAEWGWRNGEDIAEAGSTRFQEYASHLVLENEYQTKNRQHWHVRFLRTGPTIWIWINQKNDSSGIKQFESFPKNMYLAKEALRWQEDSVLKFRMRLIDQVSTPALNIDATREIQASGPVFRRFYIDVKQPIQLKVKPLAPYQCWPDSNAFVTNLLAELQVNSTEQVQLLESSSYPAKHQWKIRLQVSQAGSNEVVYHTIWQSGQLIYHLFTSFDTLIKRDEAVLSAFDSFEPLSGIKHTSPLVNRAHQAFWSDFLSRNPKRVSLASSQLSQLNFTAGDIPFFEQAWAFISRSHVRKSERKHLIYALSQIPTIDTPMVSLLATWYQQPETNAELRTAILLGLAKRTGLVASDQLWKLDSSLYPTQFDTYTSIDWENYLQEYNSNSIRYMAQVEHDIRNTGGRNTSWNLIYQWQKTDRLPEAIKIRLRPFVQQRLDSLWTLFSQSLTQREKSIALNVQVCQRMRLPDLLTYIAQDPQLDTYMDNWLMQHEAETSWWARVYYWTALWQRQQRIDDGQWKLLQAFEAGRILLVNQTAIGLVNDLNHSSLPLQQELGKSLLLAYAHPMQFPSISWLKDTLMQTATLPERWQMYQVHKAQQNAPVIAVVRPVGKMINWQNQDQYITFPAPNARWNDWEAAWIRFTSQERLSFRYFINPKIYPNPIWVR